MRAIATVFAVALLVATATAADTTCFFNATNGTVVNLSAESKYQGTTTAGYTIDVSPCELVNSTECTTMTYASVARGNSYSCFTSAPTRVFDASNNQTTFTFQSTVNTLAMLMQGSAVQRLRTIYNCDPTATNVTESDSIYNPVNYQLTVNLKSAAACPKVPETPPPAPVDSDDDGNKLSTWAIVGIIAGCVVAIVVVGFVCFKCRSGESQAEGEYARV